MIEDVQKRLKGEEEEDGGKLKEEEISENKETQQRGEDGDM